MPTRRACVQPSGQWSSSILPWHHARDRRSNWWLPLSPKARIRRIWRRTGDQRRCARDTRLSSPAHGVRARSSDLPHTTWVLRRDGRERWLKRRSVLAVVKGSILAQDYANFVADRLHTEYGTVMSAVEHARPAFQAPASNDQESATSERDRRPYRSGTFCESRARVGRTLR